MTQDIQSQLMTYHRQTFPEKTNLKIKNLTAINEGWESIVYAYDAVTTASGQRQTEGMILRIYPGTNAKQKSSREFIGMQTLYRVGYPVPKVYTLVSDNSVFDGCPFMLMERIDGEMLWPILDCAKLEQVDGLITQFCELFVQLHDLDWQEFVPEDQQSNYQEPYFFIDTYLSWLHGAAKTFPDLNVLMPVINWLKGRRDDVPCNRPAPVHWDFHPGNVILKPDGSYIVIDWTQIQVSDPRFDIGWTLLLAGGYSGDEFRNKILLDYERISGSPIKNLDYFYVANCVKRIGSVMISISLGSDQMGMRPDSVAMMRRDFPALKRMYDLMVSCCGIRIFEIEQLLAT